MSVSSLSLQIVTYFPSAPSLCSPCHFTLYSLDFTSGHFLYQTLLYWKHPLYLGNVLPVNHRAPYVVSSQQAFCDSSVFSFTHNTQLPFHFFINSVFNIRPPNSLIAYFHLAKKFLIIVVELEGTSAVTYFERQISLSNFTYTTPMRDAGCASASSLPWRGIRHGQGTWENAGRPC